MNPGDVLGAYRVVDKIGQGGMGEVYRARDTKLDRNVAIKILPEIFAFDPDRRVRFEREAKTLAALNHPNIAHIYGIEGQALVMELVEGEDLSATIARGPLPLDDALAIARQIAAALEAAHEQGIVHRDLKPANVKVNADDTVKVLDFGLAKAMDPAVAGLDSPASNAMNSPTFTAHVTRMGVILGTAAYMAPEQARGKAVDKRADIWAFGVVLYEMLSGQRAFKGEDASDTLASVLRDTPDFRALPAGTPGSVVRLLKRCLEKDPRRRLRDAGDAAIEIDEILAGAGPGSDAPPPASASRRSPGRPALVVVAALVLAAAAAAAAWFLKPPAPLPLRKFVVQARGGAAITDAAISPDGQALVFLADDKLWIQRFDTTEPRELSGITEVHALFWSPDSAMVGFQSKGQLWKVPVSGGAPTPICKVAREFSTSGGADWMADGRILFTTGGSGLMEVSALGGEPRETLAVDLKTESDFHQVSALPGGKGFLFVPHLINQPRERIDVFDGASRRTILTVGDRVDFPVYSPSGHILYGLSDGVWAVAYSLEKGAVSGAPFRIAPDGSRPRVAADGTVSLLTGQMTRDNLQLSWVDRKGGLVETVGRKGRLMQQPQASPDGRQIVGTVPGDAPGTADVWILDLDRHTERRLTYEPGVNQHPRWSPDGKSVVYGCSAGVCSRPADGTGQPAVLLPTPAAAPALSPDGSVLLFNQEVPVTSLDLFKVPLGPRGVAAPPSGAPLPFVTAERMQPDVEISPDGKYAAYISNETGVYGVYLTEFPSGRGKWQVAPGFLQRWSARGDRIYVVIGDSLNEVDISTTPSLSISEPRPLFSGQASGVQLSGYGFQPSPDGSRFLVHRTSSPASTASVTIVQNWFAEFAGRSGR